jgi:hypothetical protein
MREAAAKRAAVADRIMGDVAHDVGEESCRADPRKPAVERAWRTQAPIDELAVGNREAVERRDAIDVDEMRRLGEPERHGRHQALAAGEHAAVLRRRTSASSATASSMVFGAW